MDLRVVLFRLVQEFGKRRCFCRVVRGLSVLDAYQLVSQVVLSPVANVVDTAYTMTAKLPNAVGRTR